MLRFVLQFIFLFLFPSLLCKSPLSEISILSLSKNKTSSLQYDLNCTIQPSNTETTISLGNCQNELYFIEVGIGTPPQFLYVQLDTGSNVFWVSTKIINQYGFNSSESSTFYNLSQAYHEEYVNGGGMSGIVGTDFLTITNTSINVTSSIVFANEVNGLNLPIGIVGVLGMGFTSISKQPNFLDLAWVQNQIQSNNFSLNLQSSTDPILYYNIIPSIILNQSLYSSVSSSSFYWELEIIGVIAGLTDLTSFSANVAVIDSGTSLFYLNTELQQDFISKFLPASLCNFTDGLNICNSSIIPSLPNLTFMFPGVAIMLSSSDYVDQFGEICYVHIYSIDTTPAQILLGDTLFQEYIISYSKNQSSIGFSGNTKKIYMFGGQKFQLSQYILLGISGVFIIMGVIMMFVLRGRVIEIDTQETLRQRVTQMNSININ